MLEALFKFSIVNNFSDISKLSVTFMISPCFFKLVYNVFFLKIAFYNNCLISCMLIGSFLSLIRVQMDKILIYASFLAQLSAVKLSTF